MVVRSQFIGGWISMENKIVILFKNEEKKIEIDIANPDFANLIHRVVLWQHLGQKQVCV